MCPQWMTLFLKLRSEEHTSELQSPQNLVCRLLLEKNKASVPTNLAASMGAALYEQRTCVECYLMAQAMGPTLDHEFVLLLNSRFFFFNDTATTEIYPLPLHDALPIPRCLSSSRRPPARHTAMSSSKSSTSRASSPRSIAANNSSAKSTTISAAGMAYLPIRPGSQGVRRPAGGRLARAAPIARGRCPRRVRRPGWRQPAEPHRRTRRGPVRPRRRQLLRRRRAVLVRPCAARWPRPGNGN